MSMISVSLAEIEVAAKRLDSVYRDLKRASPDDITSARMNVRAAIEDLDKLRDRFKDHLRRCC